MWLYVKYEDGRRVNAEGVKINNKAGSGFNKERLFYSIEKSSNGWDVKRSLCETCTVDAATTIPSGKIQHIEWVLWGASSQTSPQGGGSYSAEATIQPLEQVTIPTRLAAPENFTSILNKIIDFIKNIFNIFKLEVIGASEVSPNTQQTYDVSLNAGTSLDSDHSDGTVAVRYCSVALINRNGDVLEETGFEDCVDSYSKSFTVNLPSKIDNLVVVAVMVESKGNYNVATNEWEWGEYDVIVKDALNVKTKAPAPSFTPEPPSFIKNFINTILNFLRGLFGG